MDQMNENCLNISLLTAAALQELRHRKLRHLTRMDEKHKIGFILSPWTSFNFADFYNILHITCNW